jgi:hypothetical protein
MRIFDELLAKNIQRKASRQRQKANLLELMKEPLTSNNELLPRLSRRGVDGRGGSFRCSVEKRAE